jgi:catechol 2,3-dioxygenase-like lactoylglutathione lyase family enzyme
MVLDNVTTDRLKRLAQAAETYVANAFGMNLGLQELGPEGLPYFLTDRYHFWRGDLQGRPAVFMANRSGPLDTADIAKHRELARRHLGVTLVILVLDRIEARVRRRLIEHRIAFLAPDAQLYIPEALLDLREGRQTQVAPPPDHLSPTAQLVVLGALLGRIADQQSLTDLAERYQVSVMSMSRALDELVAIGVAQAESAGRRRLLRFALNGRPLWTTVESRLKSPVRKVRLVGGQIPLEQAPMAGETALAHFTMLSPPRVERRAVLASRWMGMAQDLELEPAWADEADRLELETWSYDPLVLSEDGVVDRLSLYLSVRHEPDERVAQAAAQMLEAFSW